MSTSISHFNCFSIFRSWFYQFPSGGELHVCTQKEDLEYNEHYEQSGCAKLITPCATAQQPGPKSPNACSQDFTSVAIYLVVCELIQVDIFKVKHSSFWAAYSSLDSGLPTTAIKVSKSCQNSKLSLQSKIPISIFGL